MIFKLRYILAGAFMLVATVPVLLLGVWVEKSALDREIAGVQEQHLLIARNLTTALDRYAVDTEAAFKHFSSTYESWTSAESFSLLARQLGFRYFAIIDQKGNVVRLLNPDIPKFKRLDETIRTRLGKWTGPDVTFSDVMKDEKGLPTIFIVQKLGSDRIAIGALSTDYMISLQKTITFGRRGHAAIVDSTGHAIAHPSAKWQGDLTLITKLKPVQKMVAGETGVAKFYSPPMKGDMISGYSTVRRTGWGVMVPQPIEELKERARKFQGFASIIVMIGLLAAALLSWVLSGVLTGQVASVVKAARAITAGELEARVAPLGVMATSELHELSGAFNTMANRIQDNQHTMKAALMDAKLAERSKSEFLANISHELRTPLNAIIGFSDILKGELMGPVGSEQNKTYIADIHDSGKQLLDQINEVLDYSRIERNEVRLNDVDIAPGELLDSCLHIVRERAKSAAIQLHVDTGAQNFMIWGDQRALRQVLHNILTNAIKFTPEGGDVRVATSIETNGACLISVSDTGIGIDKKDLETVFEPFSQADASLSRKYEGAGLGLTLARALVEAHGGKLEISSELEIGTTVTIRLPADRIRIRETSVVGKATGTNG